jgi:hypothetical protein
MQVVGPIGHTFDTGAEAPLYNATSFILRPPGVDAVDGLSGTPGESDPWYGDSLAWYFAKVRFRRVLLPEMTADYRTGPQITITATEQPFDFVLAKDRGWVVDLPRILITRDPAADVDFKVKLESASLFGVVRLQQTGDKLELLSGPTDIANQPNKALLVEAAGWHEVELDLRVVHVLDTKTEPEVPGNTSRKPQPRHSSVQYRIRAVRNEPIAGPTGDRLEPASPSRVWHLLERRNWASDDAHAWPEHWKLSAPTGNVQCATPQALTARTSSYTDPQWIQFLPDSLLLRRLVTDDIAPDPRLAHFLLEWLPQSSPTEFPLQARLLRRFGDDGEWTKVTHRLSERERAAFGQVTFRRFALLTEMVSDVRGQLGQERYLGLFKFVNDADPDKCLLDVTHRFPDVGPAEIRKMRRLRVRIVEFQFVNADAAAANDTLQFGPWSHLFADEPEPQTIDAPARLVCVSPPIELQATD